MAEKYLIGIDGGGTTSRLLAVDLQRREIGACRGKSTSLESNAASVVRINLIGLLEKARETCGISLRDWEGLCFGTAGVDTEYTRIYMEHMLDDLDMHFPVRVVNDSEIALYGNTRGGPGLMLISGTGSVGYGINAEKKIWRVGGFGEELRGARVGLLVAERRDPRSADLSFKKRFDVSAAAPAAENADS